MFSAMCLGRWRSFTGRKCWPSCVAAGGQEGADSWGPCVAEQPTKAAGLHFPRDNRANCVLLKQKLKGKLCSPPAPEARRLGGGNLHFKQILRVTLKVLMINLIHAQMRIFFFKAYCISTKISHQCQSTLYSQLNI